MRAVQRLLKSGSSACKFVSAPLTCSVSSTRHHMAWQRQTFTQVRLTPGRYVKFTSLYPPTRAAEQKQRGL
eukprot:1162026-Pelagomonas_calceolata.AAC.6